MSPSACFADFSPTWSASFSGFLGGLFFGAPLALLAIILFRNRIGRLAPSPGSVWIFGMAFGGLIAVACVNLCFSIIWFRELGRAGWSDYSGDWFGGMICVSIFVLPFGAIFGAIFCQSHSSTNPPPASPSLTSDPPDPFP